LDERIADPWVSDGVADLVDTYTPEQYERVVDTFV